MPGQPDRNSDSGALLVGGREAWRIWQGTRRAVLGPTPLVRSCRCLVPSQLPSMILNVLLIAGGLLFLIATGVFLFELSRAPLGGQGEKGFVPESSGPARPGKLIPNGAATYSNSSPNAPISAL